jgi:hypothetical protein
MSAAKRISRVDGLAGPRAEAWREVLVAGDGVRESADRVQDAHLRLLLSETLMASWNLRREIAAHRKAQVAYEDAMNGLEEIERLGSRA